MLLVKLGQAISLCATAATHAANNIMDWAAVLRVVFMANLLFVASGSLRVNLGQLHIKHLPCHLVWGRTDERQY
jgi:hypothetical protein